MSRFSPDVLFLVVSEADAEELDALMAGFEEVLAAFPQAAVVPVTSTPEGVWRYHPVLGPAVSAALVYPFSAEDFQQSVLGAMERRTAGAHRRGNMLVMLPSKPGAGASTLAVNIAGVMAGEFGRKTLLVEG